MQTDSNNGLTDENALLSIVPRPLIATTNMTLMPAATSVHAKARVRRSALEEMYLIFPPCKKFPDVPDGVGLHPFSIAIRQVRSLVPPPTYRRFCRRSSKQENRK